MPCFAGLAARGGRRRRPSWNGRDPQKNICDILNGKPSEEFKFLSDIIFEFHKFGEERVGCSYNFANPFV